MRSGPYFSSADLRLAAGFGFRCFRLGRFGFGLRFRLFAFFRLGFARFAFADGRHDPNLQLRFDFLAQMHLDGVQAQFLERAFQPHLVGRDGDVVLLQGLDDFRRADRAVQMPFVVGVGFDRHALRGNAIGQLPQAGQPFVLNLQQLGFVLFDHPLVMIGGDGGQALRQQIIHGVAALHFDDFALLAQVVDRLNEQQFDAAVLAALQPLVAGGKSF